MKKERCNFWSPLKKGKKADKWTYWDEDGNQFVGHILNDGISKYFLGQDSFLIFECLF